MASKVLTVVALIFALNFISFTLTSACGYNCPTVPSPPITKPPSPPTVPSVPTPYVPPTTPNPSPPTGGNGNAKCPIDTIKLGVCADVLKGLIDVVLGTPPKEPCCSLISGLVDAEAAVCVCTALKANVLGINLNIPIDLTLLVNYCGKKVPSGYQCY